ncbi:MAG TPA: hypothetical protein DDW27_06270 [Bacteroidales bacterium]|nr:hypothetical protein [Bacteroidales bacterium]
MKKILMLVYLAFFVIILANIIYYKSLYNKQIEYITSVLDHQVLLTGFTVDETNNSFNSGLSEIRYMEDPGSFFIDQILRQQIIEKIRHFYQENQDFITGIKISDDKKNEFTIKNDEGEWLEQQFVLHIQTGIYNRDTLVKGSRNFEYYLPLIKNNIVTGNIVITVDYDKYFDQLFSVYNLKDYQWQWVVDDSGNVIYSNSANNINYTETVRITYALANGSVGNMMHNAVIGNKNKQLASSYYSTQLLGRDIALVFSSPTGYFQKYIIRNSFLIVIATLILVQAIIWFLLRLLKNRENENKRLGKSETSLVNLIEHIPAGIIVYDKNREILMANTAAADQFSLISAEDMKGKSYPETSLTAVNEYFARNPGGVFDRSQYHIIKNDSVDRILYKNSVHVTYMGKEAFMDILMDITELESARTHEAKANRAKSEFLARLSYEIRTPLTGIIGMTDILGRKQVPEELQEIVAILHNSAEDLLKIRDEILDFSKIQTGNLILEERSFILRDEIDNCVDQTKNMLEGKNVIFTVDVDKNVPVSIISDPYRFRQIFTNLITFSAGNISNGKINLRCTLVSNDKGQVKLGFELQDTGKAFDKETLNKIFGEVINIESKVLTSDDETGFGPVMAAQIIRLMGGELIVESPSDISGNSGTKVTFTLNVYSNDRIPKNLNIRSITSLNKIKTLVITDPRIEDDDILNLIHQLHLNLSVTAYQKSTIGQIKANLESDKGKYNMIIIVNDEDFNGFEVATLLWENKLYERLVIIMISKCDIKGNYLKSVSLAMDDYLVMPVDKEDLAKAIRENFPFIGSDEKSVKERRLRNGISALVVEDNKMNQKVVSRMLELLECSFEIAETGYEGYLKAKAKPYDIIFMDLILPEIDGYESARKILDDTPGALIVALTADNMPDSRSKAELSGMKEYLSKPVRIDDMKMLLEKYFSEITN